MTVHAPENDWITVHADSRRWAEVPLRAGDIVISTPPKSGTTLMQGIVHSLLWPAGDAPGAFLALSPWVDLRVAPIGEIAEQLAGQTHRRFLKTHSPADCVPIDDEVSYIVVYRDGRDAIVSWSNHRAKFLAAATDDLNAKASVDGLPPLDPHFDGADMDYLLDEWFREASSVPHLASWWPRRHKPNVCFVHYADLLADLDGEMRRVADFLGIDVPEALWSATVDRCRLDEMRAAAAAAGAGVITRLEGGADSFFHKGTNGRWVGVLSDEHLQRYDEHVAAGLTDDAAAWLAAGGSVG